MTLDFIFKDQKTKQHYPLMAKIKGTKLPDTIYLSLPDGDLEIGLKNGKLNILKDGKKLLLCSKGLMSGESSNSNTSNSK